MSPDTPIAAQARSVRLCRALALALGLIFAANAAFARDSVNFDAPADAPTAASAPEIQFDIPSQPLADALVAYGKTAGLEVFYDGALAIGRRSTEVKGTFAPMLALQALLRGTGYVPKATEHPGTVTIANAPRTAPPVATFNRYESFFAVLQTRLSEALCAGDQATPDRFDHDCRPMAASDFAH